MVGKINRVLGVSRKTYRKEYLVPLRTYIRENGIDVMPKLVEDFVKISNLEDLVSSSKFENIIQQKKEFYEFDNIYCPDI